MPNFDFQCSKCGKVKEQFVTYEERDNLIVCPKCSRITMKRVWLNAPTMRPDGDDFSNESGGRGRYNPQTKMYHRNVGEVINEAKKRGWNHSRG